MAIGRHGRGQTEGHYQAGHLMNVLFGLPGNLPSDAAEVAGIIGALRRVEVNAAGEQTVGRLTMAEAMTQMLTEVAEFLIAAKAAVDRGEAPGPWPPVPSAIVISLNMPRSALVHWAGYGRRTDTFIPEGTYLGGGALWKTTTIGRYLILTAAELLADTLSQTAQQTMPANESAGLLPGKPAPIRTHNRSGVTNDGNRSHRAQNLLGTSNTPEVKGAPEAAQLPLVTRIGHPPATGGDHGHPI